MYAGLNSKVKTLGRWCQNHRSREIMLSMVKGIRDCSSEVWWPVIIIVLEYWKLNQVYCCTCLCILGLIFVCILGCGFFSFFWRVVQVFFRF